MGHNINKCHQRLLSDAAEEEFEYLWCKTDMNHDDIAASMNQTFGLSLTGGRMCWMASRRGYTRDAMPSSRRAPGVMQQHLFDAAWHRWAYERPLDNPVRKVAPGTYPNSGYKMFAKEM